MLQRINASVCVLVIAASCGCGDPPDPTFETVNAAGKITCEGEDVADGMVTLSRLDEADGVDPPPTTGQVDGGKFVLSTYGERDGAPAGKYELQLEGSSCPCEGAVKEIDLRPGASVVKVDLSASDVPVEPEDVEGDDDDGEEDDGDGE